MRWHSKSRPTRRCSRPRRNGGIIGYGGVTATAAMTRGKLMVWSPMHYALSLCAAALLVGSGAARAELGGRVASVAADSGRMHARIASVARGNYALQELTRANDGIVREYTNANGMVFAVTWSGPGKPDLRMLLGPYFTAFQANSEVIARATHALRRPPQVNQPDLQIQTGGHMGWFHGVAFVPSLAPPGFAVTDLALDQ